MKNLDTFELEGFAYWASYLFNGDASGLEDDEIETIESWLENVPDGYYGPVDLEENGFQHNVHRGIGGDSATYVFMYDWMKDD